MMAAAGGGAETAWVFRVGQSSSSADPLTLRSIASDYDGGVIAAFNDEDYGTNGSIYMYKLDADGNVSTENNFHAPYNVTQPFNNITLFPKVGSTELWLTFVRSQEYTVAQINTSNLTPTVKTTYGNYMPRTSSYGGAAAHSSSSYMYHAYRDGYRRTVFASNSTASTYYVPTNAISRGSSFSGDYGNPFICDFGSGNVQCLNGGTHYNGSEYFPKVTLYNTNAVTEQFDAYFDDNSQNGNPNWLSRSYRLNVLGAEGHSNTYVLPFRIYFNRSFALGNFSRLVTNNWCYEYDSSNFPQFPTDPTVQYDDTNSCYYVAFQDDDDTYHVRLDTSGNVEWAFKLTVSNPAGPVYATSFWHSLKMALNRDSSGNAAGGYFWRLNILQKSYPERAETILKVPSTGIAAGTYTDTGGGSFTNTTFTVTDITSSVSRTSRILSARGVAPSNHSRSIEYLAGGLAGVGAKTFVESTTALS